MSIMFSGERYGSRQFFVRCIASLWGVFSLGCGGGAAAEDGTETQALSCMEARSEPCQPAYAPTFENLFTNQFGKSCGAASTGGSCHSSEGRKGGLDLSEEGLAYKSLLGLEGERVRVIPGEPECSPLMQRLEGEGAGGEMPPGADQLPEAVRCAIHAWIAEGAER